MTSLARFGLFAVAMTTACNMSPPYCEGDWAAAQPADEPATPTARVVAQVLPTESTAVDMLFVIDDSKSMTDEQYQLGVWAGEMFDVLSTSGALPDLHIAVTSSSVEIPGLTQCPTTGGLHVGGAKLDATTRFLTDAAGPDGTRVRNYSGTLTDTFAQMAKVGDMGCGFEQPFQAARLVLDGSTYGAKGFLRDDALLLVVFVTDEDDCSATDGSLFLDPYSDSCSTLGTLTSYRCFEHGVTCYDGKGSRAFGDRKNCHPAEDSLYVQSVGGFADFLKSVKKDPAQVIVAGIYGKPNHISTVPDEKITWEQQPRLADVCGSGGVEGTGATPAVRMNALLAKFGGRASQSSICESQLSWAMRNVGLVTRGAATRSTCLRGALIDTDVAADGVQPKCHVEAVRNAGTALEKRLEVPPCDGERVTGCFTVANDRACSDTETQLAFHVDGLADGQTFVASCDVDSSAPELAPSIGETLGPE